MSKVDKKWIPVEYFDSDKDEVLNLIKSFYGDIDTTFVDYFDWQTKQNPAGSAIIWLAKSKNDNSVVGMYMVIPLKYINCGREHLGSISLNTLTKSDYYKRGIFTGLAENTYNSCKQAGIEFTLGFPNPNSFSGFINKLNFNLLGELPLLLYPLKPSGIARYLLKNSLLSKFFPPADIIAKLNGISIVRSSAEISIINKFPKEFNQFWEENKNNYNAMLIRDANFVNWRYVSIPRRKYIVMLSRSSSGIIGYIVGRITQLNGIKCGMVVDLLVKQTYEGIKGGNALLHGLLEMYRKNNVELVGSLMNMNTMEYKILRKKLFVSCPKSLLPQRFPVIYRNHLKKLDRINVNLQGCFLTMGDYDVI